MKNCQHSQLKIKFFAAKREDFLPRRREERKGHQDKEDFGLIQVLQDFLRDLSALAVPRFWFRLARVRNLIENIILISALLLLPACAVSTFGKFQYEKGIPSFIKAGETTSKEVFDKLGEPLVHRFVAGKETAIYNSEQGYFWFVYGTYEGHELIIRFENDIVSDAKIEQTGTGWGLFAPANANNPGTLRSSR